MTADAVLTAIRRRRVVRHFTDRPVSREDLLQILQAGRWAPSGGNKRLHRFVAVQDPVTVRLIRAISPMGLRSENPPPTANLLQPTLTHGLCSRMLSA